MIYLIWQWLVGDNLYIGIYDDYAYSELNFTLWLEKVIMYTSFTLFKFSKNAIVEMAWIEVDNMQSSSNLRVSSKLKTFVLKFSCHGKKKKHKTVGLFIAKTVDYQSVQLMTRLFLKV